MKTICFSKIVIRQQISYRGGGIEIDLTSLGYPGERMTAYQNHLGGGMLGRICSDCTMKRHKFIELSVAQELDNIADQLKQYFHALTVHDDDFESMTYEQNQRMPVSAY